MKHLFYKTPAFFLSRSYMVSNIFHYSKMQINRGVLNGEFSTFKVWFKYRNRKYYIDVCLESIEMYYYKNKKIVYVSYSDTKIYSDIYYSIKKR
jgi:hypothetical protein